MNFAKTGRRFGLALLVALFAGVAAAQTYDGDWAGALSAGGQTLHLELHVKTAGGATTAVLDSLDQGASIPSTAIKTDGGEFSALFLSINGEFKGKLSADGKTLSVVNDCTATTGCMPNGKSTETWVKQ